MTVETGRKVMALLLITVVPSIGMVQATVVLDGGDLRVGRYQTSVPQPRPDQRDLLSAMVEIELSDDVETVGQAVVAVLEDSGYRLSSNPASCQEKLFELPLPAVHRRLGPLTLRQALEILTGPAYEFAADPVKRLISFERVPADEPSSIEECDCD